jgi:hypothetical protein
MRARIIANNAINNPDTVAFNGIDGKEGMDC